MTRAWTLRYVVLSIIVLMLPTGPASAVNSVAGEVAGAAVSPFGDVPNTHEFAEAIVWLAEEGITRGCNPPANDRFCPDDPVTRGQMAAFLVRAFGYSARGSYEFVDDDGSVFEGDVERLAEADVTRGCNPPSNDRFCPDDPVTRGQMATFLWRADGSPEPDGSGGGGGSSDDPGPRNIVRTPEKSSDVIVHPGDDVEAVVDGAAPGATIRFRPGVYRMMELAPKAGMSMIADAGVVLKGSKILGDDETWVVDGTRWYVTGQTHGAAGAVEGEEWGYCDFDRPACVFPEDVFFDGEPLRRVSSLGAVITGTWYFDYGADRIYVGQNPNGHTVETSVMSWAFHGNADSVRIEGFTLEQYATPGRQGVVNPRIGRVGDNGVDWVVVGNTIRHGHAWGIKIEHGMVIADNTTEGNGQGGIGGVGNGVLVEHNLIDGNCQAGYRCLGWEGGAMKVDTDSMVISDNVVTQNLGHGIHPDIDSHDVVIDGNVVTDNDGAGIHYETSTSGVISNNVVERNGFKSDGTREPGILILDSSEVEVIGNRLEDNALGILLRQDDRTSRGIVGNISVSSNIVVAGAASRSGIGTVTIDIGLLGPISFANNTYSSVDDKPFTLNGTTMTPETWVAQGYDSNSTFTKR